MSDEMHAWAAGFIDGEGSLEVRYTARRYAIRLSASQAHYREPLDRLVSLYGGTIHPLRGVEAQKNSPVEVWVLTGAGAVGKVLTAIRPWLTVKAVQADLALAYCATIDPLRRSPLTEQEVAFRDRTIREIRAAKRGVAA